VSVDESPWGSSSCAHCRRHCCR